MELVYTRGVAGQKWPVIGNELVRLQLIYKTFLPSFPTPQHTGVFEQTHTHARVHTYTSYAPFWLQWQPPREPIDNIIFIPWEQHLLENKTAALFQSYNFLAALVYKAFLRPCSQFSLWQHDGQEMYCTWSSGLHIWPWQWSGGEKPGWQWGSFRGGRWHRVQPRGGRPS